MANALFGKTVINDTFFEYDLSCFSCYTCWHVTGYLAWNRKTRWKKDASLFIKHHEIIGEILQYQLLLHL